MLIAVVAAAAAAAAATEEEKQENWLTSGVKSKRRLRQYDNVERVSLLSSAAVVV